MATGHRGPIILNEYEQSDLEQFKQLFDAEIKQRRLNPTEPQPITFSEAIPRDVTAQTVEAIRKHYRPTFGVQVDHTHVDVWVLLFTCHTRRLQESRHAIRSTVPA